MNPLERFAIGMGRKRPPFVPRNISCPDCGGKLEVPDERAQLVVCAYCSHKLDLTDAETKVLGAGPPRKWEFPLNIGDRFAWKGGRYEVTARMVEIEDENESEATRLYYLYSPRRGAMWLSEYGGSWDLSTTTHVKPKSNPFVAARGDEIETFDGRKWKWAESGVYELAYVDGALPWLARIGDRHSYAEFAEKGGTRTLEAESSGDEIEIGVVQPLTPKQVAEALGRTDVSPIPGVQAAEEDAGDQARRGRIVIAAACVAALVLNGLLYFWASGRGEERVRTDLEPAAMTAGAETKPFFVENPGSVIKVVLEAGGLSNAWMAVDVDLVRHEDGAEVHSYPATFEYFSGVEGGESWSEGSRDDTTFIKIAKDGWYRLRLQAVSAMGDATEATAAIHGLRVSVTDGAAIPKYFMIMSFLAGGLALVFGFSLLRQDEDDDDDD
ncbi:MAG: DUF4178 domain-containing protein [Deltaproteobacteria bacterium]|nr:DUF4178 domain-containing protein [Deltaproteobacteria bacterium]